VQIARLYIELLKKSLTCSLYSQSDGSVVRATAAWKRWMLRLLARRNLRLVRYTPPEQLGREVGADWPTMALTMIGHKRLDNLQECIESVLRDKVPGDLIETGVWRGGATIFMRGVLKAHGVRDRTVWVADSFEGLPRPNAVKYPADLGDTTYSLPFLAVSLEEVRANFARLGLLDDQVRFLKGWFRDTLPVAPIDQLAVARLDGDLYESTMDALVHLYPKIAPGGYLIVDDYEAYPACKKAIHEYRNAHGIDEEIRHIDWTGVFWRKSMV
jgi:O-methyltransferase